MSELYGYMDDGDVLNGGMGITEADFHPAPAPNNETDRLADIENALRILLGGETE